MKFLINKEIISPSFEQVTSILPELSLQTAKLYQSVFAEDPWNEVGRSPEGQSLALSEVEDNFEPFFRIERLRSKIEQVFANPDNIVIISLNPESYTINQNIRQVAQPQYGQFPLSVGTQPLPIFESYVSGFLWATNRQTQDILEVKGGFDTLQAQEYITSNQLPANSLFINELGVAPCFQRQGSGAQMTKYLKYELDQRDLPVFTNTSEESGAYKLFSRMGASVIAGPGVNGRSGYVLFSKT